MELETPLTIDCPLCGGGPVTVQENKSGNPYFTCRSETCKTTVNLNGDDAEELIRTYADDADVDLEQEDDPEPESGGSAKLGDLVGGNNDGE